MEERVGPQPGDGWVPQVDVQREQPSQADAGLAVGWTVEGRPLASSTVT